MKKVYGRVHFYRYDIDKNMSQSDPSYNSNNFTIGDEYSTAYGSALITNGSITLRNTNSFQFTNGSIPNMNNFKLTVNNVTTNSIVAGIVDISYGYTDTSYNYFNISRLFVNTSTNKFDTGYSSFDPSNVQMASGILTVNKGMNNPTTKYLYVDTGVLDTSFITYDISHNYVNINNAFINTSTNKFDTGYSSVASTNVPITTPNKGVLTVNSGMNNPTTKYLYVDTGVLDVSFITYDISHNYVNVNNVFINTLTNKFDTGYSSVVSTNVPITTPNKGVLTVNSGMNNPTTKYLYVDTGVLDVSAITYDISHNYVNVNNVIINTLTHTFDTGYSAVVSTNVPITTPNKGVLTVNSGMNNPTTKYLYVDTGILDVSAIVYDISHNYATITNGFFDLSTNMRYNNFNSVLTDTSYNLSGGRTLRVTTGYVDSSNSMLYVTTGTLYDTSSNSTTVSNVLVHLTNSAIDTSFSDVSGQSYLGIAGGTLTVSNGKVLSPFLYVSNGIIDTSFVVMDISHTYTDVSLALVDTSRNTIHSRFVSSTAPVYVTIDASHGNVTVQSGKYDASANLVLVNTGIWDVSFVVMDISHIYTDVSAALVNTTSKTIHSYFSAVTNPPKRYVTNDVSFGWLNIETGNSNVSANLMLINKGIWDVSFVYADVSNLTGVVVNNTNSITWTDGGTMNVSNCDIFCESGSVTMVGSVNNIAATNSRITKAAAVIKEPSYDLTSGTRRFKNRVMKITNGTITVTSSQFDLSGNPIPIDVSAGQLTLPYSATVDMSSNNSIITTYDGTNTFTIDNSNNRLYGLGKTGYVYNIYGSVDITGALMNLVNARITPNGTRTTVGATTTDMSFNFKDYHTLDYFSQNFAFPASSTLSVSQGFSSVHRLPEAQVNIFDVTGSVEILLAASNINTLLGITKVPRPNSQGWLLANNSSTNNYYNSISNQFTQVSNDSVELSSSAFVSSITGSSQIVTVGNFKSIYTDFATYVASYFGLSSGTGLQTGIAPITNGVTKTPAATGVATGVSTLFSGAYGFHCNPGDTFGSDQLYSIIQGSGSHATDNSGFNTLQGSIKLWNVTKLLRYAVDSNCFGNRNPDPSSNTVGNAIDPSGSFNYGVTDGFLAGDMIFIPNNGLAITLNLNINYTTTINTYIKNNSNYGSAVPLQQQLDSSFSDVSYSAPTGTVQTSSSAIINSQTDRSAFHATTVSNANLISRTISCPLLLRLI